MASERHRRRRRRGRFSGLYKVISIFIIAAAVTAACAVFFRVNSIAVEGSVRYTAEQIIEASGVTQGSNLIAVRRQQAAGQIIRQLPYIDTVAVNRRLPDTLIITVTECVPVYSMAAEEGGWWILDAGGKILERRDSAEGYAVITGISPLVPAPGTRLVVRDEEQEKLTGLLELMAALRRQNMAEKVDSIDLSGVYLITMIYDTRFTVRIPLVTDFAYRIRWLAEAVGNESVLEDKEYVVDMSVEGEMRFIPK